jgi:NADPH:quinone reductase-like Zn-dependent oxidoreductase
MGSRRCGGLVGMTMKQWVLPADAHTADALELRKVPVPEPGAGQVRIRVRAVSVNGRDHMILRGPFGRIPGRELVPLSDVAGIVDAVGTGVRQFAVGDSVTNLHWEDGPVPRAPLGLGALDTPGVLSTFVVLPENQVAHAPAHLDHHESATVPVAGLTAWNALFGDHPLVAGQKVASIGTGGVAIYTMQLALAAGAEYFGVVRRPDLSPLLSELGANGVVDVDPWSAKLKELTGGVHKIVDTVGSRTLGQSLASLAWQGEVALVGLFIQESWPVDPMLFFTSGGSLRGVAVGTAAQHRDLVTFLEQHRIHPVIDSVHDFGDAPKALTARSAMVGKTVITVP